MRVGLFAALPISDVFGMGESYIRYRIYDISRRNKSYCIQFAIAFLLFGCFRPAIYKVLRKLVNFSGDSYALSLFASIGFRLRAIFSRISRSTIGSDLYICMISIAPISSSSPP